MDEYVATGSVQFGAQSIGFEVVFGWPSGFGAPTAGDVVDVVSDRVRVVVDRIRTGEK